MWLTRRLPKRQDVDSLGTFNLVRCDVADLAAGNHEFSQEGAATRFAEDEWCSAQVALERYGEGIDGALRRVEILARFCTEEQEVEKLDQVFTGCVGVSDLKFTVHPSTCLRRASSRA